MSEVPFKFSLGLLCVLFSVPRPNITGENVFKSLGSGVSQTWVQVLALPLSGYLIWEKFFNLPEHLKGNNY